MRHEFTIPVQVHSKANQRQHWAERAREAKSERTKAWRHARMAIVYLQPELVVTLTRIGPRELDSDNLVSSLKNIRDGVADRLRIDDGSQLVEWRYAQERGEYAVRVCIERARP